MARKRPNGSLGWVRRELASLGRQPRRRWAQHFLSDLGVARRIVETARVEGARAVLEIGPGLGVLTDFLAPLAERLILIEIDRDLAARLRRRYVSLRHVAVLEEDALAVDYRTLLEGCSPAVAIGNLPYNIATPLITHLLAARDRFSRLVFLLQKEVAARIAAPAGSPAYGALSATVQMYCDVRIAFPVSPGAFVPQPKVRSALVVMEPLPHSRCDIGDAQRFQRIVRGLFLHRRKQLVNAAKGVLAEPETALAAAGLDPRRRPETLTLEELARLARTANECPSYRKSR